MKNALVISLMFVIVLPGYAELTKEDVRQIVRDEIEPLKLEMATVKGEIQALKVTIAEMDKRISAQFKAVDSKFEAVDSKISMLQWLMIALIAITVVAITMPQLLIAYRERKETRFR
jgi:hypothetical protein